MSFDNEIICSDSNGNETNFLYSLNESNEQGRKKWVFKVMPHDLNATDWYEFSITEIDGTTGKITLMNNRNLPEYRGKGITIKLIEEASNVLGLTIISSTNVEEAMTLDTEWRTEPATKIWEKLRAQGLAVYDEATDIYTYVPSVK